MDSRRWVSREEWAARVRGVACPLCAELAGTAHAEAEGVPVANLRFSRLRLQANQWIPGYCVLVCRRHVREPHELEPGDRAAFFEDLTLAAHAVERAVGADKMNLQLLGNAVPHLHAHIVPRFLGDPAPHLPIDPNLGQRRLSETELATRLGAIRAELGIG